MGNWGWFFRAELLFHRINKFSQAGIVGTLPVNLRTICTYVEFVVVKYCFGFQTIQDGFFGNGLEQPIAAQTAGCGLNFVEEMITVENGRYLFI